MDYSKTINLPKTAFPMKANLPSREPEFQGKWEEMKLYEKILERRKGRPIFILHDGPPYSNGDIHMGHALNKILKDFIVRYKMLRGFYTPFIPGWDNHGMPIEKEVQEEILKEKIEPSVTLIRQRCRNFAAHFIEVQKQQFKRLGIIGDWDHPYLTMDNEYEADLVRIFGELYFKGYIYRTLKPILWCPNCKTALAEAEIEYHEKVSPSIWVAFPLREGKGKLESTYAIIWTTTPWTLPGNVAIMIHPDFHYVIVEVKGKKFLIGKETIERVKEELGWEEIEIEEEFKGRNLEGVVFSHPFLERESPLVLSEFVTAEQGSGLVHCAPGHGEEDYLVGREYNLPILSPVNAEGKFTDEAGEFAGLSVMQEGNDAIVSVLQKRDLLLKHSEITHEYPHCWRCKKPLIFRATVQWFMNIDHQGHREKCLREIENTRWIPSQMINRIYNMVKTRPDWCLSRQRAWGVGIPAFYCEDCDEVVITPETIDRVFKLIKEKGSDAWFELPPEEILPQGFACPKCGGKSFRKEKDILDVWFDSGSSHLCVLDKKGKDLKWPADIYLEGADQHRGWFNSSLMIGVAIKGRAPYETVITNGWVLDAQGHPMHKSLGNVISPLEVVQRFGADVLRLWISSLNCTEDVHMSFEIVEQVAESYRKIRNTLRFILGNLYDFHPDSALPKEKLFGLDRFMLSKLQTLIKSVTDAYESFQFHRAYHIILDFCVNWLSALYLDILKDRLYIYPSGSIERLSAQSTLFEIAKVLITLLAPVIPHTAEEAFQHLPQWNGKPESVHLTDWPEVNEEFVDENLEKDWEKIWEIRRKVYKQIEEERSKGLITHPLEASIDIYLPIDYLTVISRLDGKLSDILITSSASVHSIEEAPQISKTVEDIKVVVEKAKGRKCARCWQIKESVGIDHEHPELCERCVAIIKSIETEIL